MTDYWDKVSPLACIRAALGMEIERQRSAWHEGFIWMPAQDLDIDRLAEQVEGALAQWLP